MPSLQQPPQDIELEYATLAAMLYDSEMRREILTILGPDDFAFDLHRRACRAITALGERSIVAEPVAVGQELCTKLGLDDLQWFELSEQIEARKFSICNGTYHASLVRQYSLRRKLLDVAHSIDDASRALDRDFSDVIADAERLILEVSEADVADEVVHASVPVDRALERLASRRAGVVPGLTTGVQKLDLMTGGLHPGQVALLAARPGMGKTAMGLQIALHVAIDLKETVLFFSIEMSEDEIADRIIVQRATLDGSAFRRGDVNDDDEILIASVRDAVLDTPLYLDDRVVSAARIGTLARRQKMRSGLSLIVIDYAQLVDADHRKGESRQESVSRISRDLKRIAKELKIPVLALSQLNRLTEQREEKRPRMADLRESGALENDAHHVWLLHRPDYYDPTDQPGLTELIIAKNRNGPPGVIELEFLKEQMRFVPWSQPYGPGGNGVQVHYPGDDIDEDTTPF